jgi:hypothetical protein
MVMLAGAEPDGTSAYACSEAVETQAAANAAGAYQLKVAVQANTRGGCRGNG